MKDAQAATGNTVFLGRRSARTGRCTLGLLLAALIASPALAAPTAQPEIELISVTIHGEAAEGRSDGPAVDNHGNFVAFNSDARDLVSPPRANRRSEVYLRVLLDETTLIVTNAPNGAPANRPSDAGGFAPGVSGDGRFVAFSSNATNLVADDNSLFESIYVHDHTTGETQLISRGLDGQPSNGASNFPRLSADGRYVVFQSQASNLVENDTNESVDIFVYDRLEAVMRLVSVNDAGEAGNDDSITPDISDDGRVVAFASKARNLSGDVNSRGIGQIYARAWQGGPTVLISVAANGLSGNLVSFLPVLTADGTEVAFKSEAFNLVPNDTNGVPDVFVRNQAEGSTQRVSVDSFGNQANGLSAAPGISGDGRFVAFASFASNLVLDDGNGFSDVYVYDRFPPDRAQGTIARVTVGFDGSEPNEGVPDFPVAISLDGRFVGFASASSNLVPNDRNNDFDVFLACNPFEETNCALLTPTPTPTDGIRPCVGDCDGDGDVSIGDLIKMVNIALGRRDVCGDDGEGQCLAGDANCDCRITIDEIIKAVNNSLNGCTTFGECSIPQHEEICCDMPPTPGTPTATRTATPTPPVTPTATPTTPGTPVCAGDCNGNGTVNIDDLIRMVNIALGLQVICPSDAGPGCLAGDANCNCLITIDDIIKAVNNSLNGCTIFRTCGDEPMCCAVP
ncbi:MAG: TolB family protein [Candidatus Binatia bacterium]